MIVQMYTQQQHSDTRAYSVLQICPELSVAEMSGSFYLLLMYMSADHCLLTLKHPAVLFAQSNNVHVACSGQGRTNCLGLLSGVAWTSFNAAQRQARRGIMPLYTTSRPLVKNVGNIAQHTFVPLFAVQVRL